MSAPPHQRRAGPWVWQGAPSADDPATPPRPDYRGQPHMAGFAHPGQRAKAKRRDHRREKGRRG